MNLKLVYFIASLQLPDNVIFAFSALFVQPNIKKWQVCPSFCGTCENISSATQQLAWAVGF
jgi:hypothetical protein